MLPACPPGSDLRRKGILYSSGGLGFFLLFLEFFVLVF